MKRKINLKKFFKTEKEKSSIWKQKIRKKNYKTKDIRNHGRLIGMYTKKNEIKSNFIFFISKKRLI